MNPGGSHELGEHTGCVGDIAFGERSICAYGRAEIEMMDSVMSFSFSFDGETKAGTTHLN